MTTYTAANGRTFRLVGSEPYTRKDGTPTTLYRWQAPCAHEGCTVPIDVKTPACEPAQFPSYSSFRRVHCDHHKITREEATRKWADACKKSNTVMTAEKLEEMRLLREYGDSVKNIADHFGISVSRVYALLAKTADP